MTLIVAELSIELIETLRPLMTRIKARDKSLEDQIRRAASSVALNIGEGEYSDPGNRRARYFTAAGSAGETLAAVRVAVAWGIVSKSDAERAVTLLKRIIPMLWKLTRG
jgi:four helix bundle protein